MKRIGQAALVLGLCLGLCLPGCDRQDAAPVAAPALPLQVSLEALHGGAAASLADWRGKTVVLNVWASWCAPCRAEMASLQRLSRALDPERAIVIGLTVDDDRNLAREYLLRNGIDFANFTERDKRSGSGALGVQSLPETLVINPDGSLRERLVGKRDWDDAQLARRLGLPLRRPADRP